ncbi:hypothetical protein FCM30_19690 [Lelliottia aquatilis]|uniref:hypothetical protein n=1 Tax=Lelliottia aquatilis TaxID=2080838 RepID=UPI0015775EA1|nr:hypothetical protein [Lelliottia aquatilis]NTZ47960.1 hypothetical protein [Lelliottia aquatilis]
MTTKFFSTPRIQQLMRDYMKTLESLEITSEFEKTRNALLVSIFDIFLKKSEEWDEKAEFNIENIGDVFASELEDKLLTTQSLNIIFTSCFRFCVEPTIFDEALDAPFNTIKEIKNFGIYRYNEFDDRSKGQIDYALREMPLNLIRATFNGDEIHTFRDFMNNVRSAKDFAANWKMYIEEKENNINEIKSKLEGYQSAFNFVGLYEGFKLLGDQKGREIFWSRLLLVALAIAIPCPLIIEIIYTVLKTNEVSSLNKLITFIPLFSLTLILIYYFRVALNNHTSLKAQTLQIDLRKSLCQFIQSYADYSKSIKDSNPNSLMKFEDIIFSNIMPNQEKIPSTFDGIEQIASLISAIKPK